MQSFIEIIYIDSEDLAQQTNMRHVGKTNAETRATFRRFRRYSVDIKNARFLVDYHDRKGDLVDTIAIDAAGFTAITGQQPKSEAEYQKIDQEFWDNVRNAA